MVPMLQGPLPTNIDKILKLQSNIAQEETNLSDNIYKPKMLQINRISPILP